MSNPNPQTIDEKDRLHESDRNKRMNICNSCDRLSILKFCKECGCMMPIKTYLSFTKCPLGKW